MNLWHRIKELLAPAQHQRQQDKLTVVSYEESINYLSEVFTYAADLVHKEFRLAFNGRRLSLFYLKSVADENQIAQEIILPLSSYAAMITPPPRQVESIVATGTVKQNTDLYAAEQGILHGHTTIVLEGLNYLIDADTRLALGRNVETAQIETTILGPKSAFVESVGANLSLVRQRLRSSQLKAETFFFGEASTTKAIFLYHAGKAPPQIVEAVRSRLKAVKVQELQELNYLENLLGVSPFSPFPQAIYTERPDRVAGNLLEGRVAILLDGSPEAVVLPAAFADLFQSPEDYYTRTAYATFIRSIRFIAFFLATTFPGLYVSLLAFNYEIFPPDLGIAVAMARVDIPFDPWVEALIMMVLVDILQEGATRLPSRIGQTVGVIGGFILGQAVIQANIVSPLLVIVIAVAVISSFVAPDYKTQGLMRLLRYPIVLAGAAMGGIGIAALWFAIVAHLCSLTILGTPYLRPVASFRVRDLSDFIYRRPYRSDEPEQASRLSGGSSA